MSGTMSATMSDTKRGVATQIKKNFKQEHLVDTLLWACFEPSSQWLIRKVEVQKDT